MLPDNVRVDCGPYGKRYPTRDKSNACPKCEVPPEELGSRAGHHRAGDYARYERYERENPPLDSETHDATHARYTNELMVSRGGKTFFKDS